jgi:predicted DNA repair protein MutK
MENGAGGDRFSFPCLGRAGRYWTLQIITRWKPMPSGLVALLDDVAAITKLAAASLDDIGAAAGKAGSKAAGVVIDDTAVTPRYVTGFTPERELPIIARIAKGSLRNKLLFLLPAALALSALAPWLITPLLMLGAAFLCFEGTEKIVEALFHHDDHKADLPVILDPAAHEKEMVSGAIRTDFILSAEIMAIALADVADRPLGVQAAVLAAVGIAITIGVYGAVALIVKMDDVGLHLAERRLSPLRAVGRGLVIGMPIIMRALSIIGTAAMIWVGGGIVVHGLEEFGVAGPGHVIHDTAAAAGHAIPAAHAAVEWLVTAAGSGLVGLVVGAVIVGLLHLVKGKKAHH